MFGYVGTLGACADEVLLPMSFSRSMGLDNRNGEPDRASQAPREPTSDPLRFIIPERHVPAALAQRLLAGAEAVEPRPASTVCLLRETRAGLEALLVRRPGRSRFAADAWVFPGGTVDPADASPHLLEESGSASAEQWAKRLGITDPAEAASYVVAAVREAWEETGILLTDRPDPNTVHRLEEAREELLSGALLFGALLQREAWRLRLGELLYVAHWVTPEAEPRRYDTRFFVSLVGHDAECVLSGEELMEARWMPAGAAVQDFMQGRLRMLPPTIHTLQRIAPFTSYRELRRQIGDAPVPTICPRMRRVEEGVAVEIDDEDLSA